MNRNQKSTLFSLLGFNLNVGLPVWLDSSNSLMMARTAVRELRADIDCVRPNQDLLAAL